MMTNIESALQSVKKRIATAAINANRQPDEIMLLAASKTNPAEQVKKAWLAGQTIFGENYLQEALEKILALSDLPIEWHFIGPIQSNKTKRIAENFAWVHSVDRKKIARSFVERQAQNTSPASSMPTSKCKRRRYEKWYIT